LPLLRRGGIFSKRYEKKHGFHFLLCAFAPLLFVNLGNVYLSNQFNLGNMWLKINQSKITNYAKQTQFPKSQKWL
jgi:hypothetical protein